MLNKLRERHEELVAVCTDVKELEGVQAATLLLVYPRPRYVRFVFVHEIEVRSAVCRVHIGHVVRAESMVYNLCLVS